jgi:hypothetical protein
MANPLASKACDPSSSLGAPAICSRCKADNDRPGLKTCTYCAAYFTARPPRYKRRPPQLRKCETCIRQVLSKTNRPRYCPWCIRKRDNATARLRYRLLFPLSDSRP